MLGRHGYRVVLGGGDGAEVLERASRLRPEVALLDLRMQAADGLKTARQIWEQRLAPVVLLSACITPDLVCSARDAGVLTFLTEPLREPDLIAALEITAHLWSQAERLRSAIESLKEKLEARDLVERAKTILMAQYGLREQEAFRKLQTQAMAMRRSMKRIAEAVIIAYETGRRDP